MIETVKGFRDIEDSSKRVAIRNVIEEVFKLYNYKPVDTPTEIVIPSNMSPKISFNMVVSFLS